MHRVTEQAGRRPRSARTPSLNLSRGPLKIRRGATAKVNLSDFRGNTRPKWRFHDVEYLRGTPRPGLLFTIAPRKI